MAGLEDWIEILDKHDEKYGTEPRAVLELQPSEVDRLRHDLQAALDELKLEQQHVVDLNALLKRYDEALVRTQKLAEGFREAFQKAMALAQHRAEQVVVN